MRKLWFLLTPILLVHLSPTPLAHSQQIPAHRCPEPVPIHSASEIEPVSYSLPLVHRFATGLGIRVAVIDTGVSNHPRLGGVQPGGDFVDNTSADETALFDCDGHGTIVAGIIAARPGADEVVGIAPDSTVISVRQTSGFQRQEDKIGAGTLATVAAAIERALDLQADVINISVVSCLPATMKGKVDTTALDNSLKRAEQMGTVVVAAAGNVGQQCEPDSLVYPAQSPTVLAVSASENSYELASYSVAVPHGPISAPGAVSVGLSPRDDQLVRGMKTASGETSFIGTSFAAPVISGVVALLKQRFPEDSAAQLRERVRQAASPGTGHVEPKEALSNMLSPVSVEKSVTIAPSEKASMASKSRALVMLSLLFLLATCGAVTLSLIRNSRV